MRDYFIFTEYSIYIQQSGVKYPNLFELKKLKSWGSNPDKTGKINVATNIYH